MSSAAGAMVAIASLGLVAVVAARRGRILQHHCICPVERNWA